MKTLARVKPPVFNGLPSVFDDFFNNGNVKHFSKSPEVNIVDSEKEFRIEMSLAGYSKKDVHINLENDLLTISSEKTNNELKEGEHFTKREFSHCHFNRSFTIPEIVDIEGIDAKFKDGILQVTLPKNEEILKNKVKTISIK